MEANKRKILVIGDSHALIFNHPAWRETTPFADWDVVSVGGATLSGLTNPHSQTQAMPIFEEALHKRETDALVFQLGEVDFGFVIHYRAEKKEVSIDEAFQKAVDNYQRLLIKAATVSSDIFVLSTCLPTIKDGQIFGNVANLRKEIHATQYERTALTVRFNGLMERWCKENEICFINTDQDVLCAKGVIDERFLHTDKADHHYEPQNYIELLRHKLVPVLIERCVLARNKQNEGI